MENKNEKVALSDELVESVSGGEWNGKDLYMVCAKCTCTRCFHKRSGEWHCEVCDGTETLKF